MWVPHKINNNNKKKQKNKRKERKEKSPEREREKVKFYFFIFLFSLTSLFDLRKSDRQNSSGEEAKCCTRRGLRVGTKNTGFRRIFN